MKYAAKCIAIFIVLTILLTLVGTYAVKISLPFSGVFLYSAFASLLLTIFYGWIDSVYIKKRQPGLEK